MKRHDLVYLHPHIHLHNLDYPDDVMALVNHYIVQGVPFTLCRQVSRQHHTYKIAMNVLHQQRKIRFSCDVEPSAIAHIEPAILLKNILNFFDDDERHHLHDFIHQLEKIGIDARVYGSFSAQYFMQPYLNGQYFIRADSDLDILLNIETKQNIDIILKYIQQLKSQCSRLIDGELSMCYYNEQGELEPYQCSFNELIALDNTLNQHILVKSLYDVKLVNVLAFLKANVGE